MTGCLNSEGFASGAKIENISLCESSLGYVSLTTWIFKFIQFL